MNEYKQTLFTFEKTVLIFGNRINILYKYESYAPICCMLYIGTLEVSELPEIREKTRPERNILFHGLQFRVEWL